MTRCAVVVPPPAMLERSMTSVTALTGLAMNYPFAREDRGRTFNVCRSPGHIAREASGLLRTEHSVALNRAAESRQDRLNEIVRGTIGAFSMPLTRTSRRIPNDDALLDKPDAPVQVPWRSAKRYERVAPIFACEWYSSGPVSASPMSMNAPTSPAAASTLRNASWIAATPVTSSYRNACRRSRQYRQWQPHLHDLGDVS